MKQAIETKDANVRIAELERQLAETEADRDYRQRLLEAECRDTAKFRASLAALTQERNHLRGLLGDLRSEYLIMSRDSSLLSHPRLMQRVEAALAAPGRTERWDKNANQDALCAYPECGHPYYRHFDTYDDMRAVGCKYCGCAAFVPKPTTADLAAPGRTEPLDVPVWERRESRREGES